MKNIRNCDCLKLEIKTNFEQLCWLLMATMNIVIGDLMTLNDAWHPIKLNRNKKNNQLRPIKTMMSYSLYNIIYILY